MHGVRIAPRRPKASAKGHHTMNGPQGTATRRALLSGAGLAAGGLLLAGCAQVKVRSGGPEPGLKVPVTEEAEVTPVEDLMREHGLLRRVTLIYAEVIRRLETATEVPVAALVEAAGIIRSFVQDYHEKLEEDFLFPRFRKADMLVDLVDVLLAQHKAGRAVTDATLRLANAESLKKPDDRWALVKSLNQFIRMYNPHAAREDTVLFPAVHEVFWAKEYDKLGDVFEDKEQKLFGKEGFEKMVARVADIEKTLGISDLAQFTPKA
jgi:hemerythrin-like domain-containing protein